MSQERRLQPTTKELLIKLTEEVAGLKVKVAELDAALQQERHPNQTPEEWLEATDPADLGTGLFLVPDMEAVSETAVSKIYVPGLTYAQCVRKGRRSNAFQWVPESIATYDDLVSTSCKIPSE